MIFRLFFYIPTLFVLIPYNAVYASQSSNLTAWELVKNKQGIQVYTATVTDSALLKVKAQVIIKAGIQQIQTILDDAPQRKNWIPYLHNSTVVKPLSSTEKLEYAHFSAPWPASDRDFVYRIRLLHQDNNKLIYHMQSENSHLLPVKNNIIRAELIESIYTLTTLDHQQTQVELIFHADPKGWLPVWIINIIQKTLPYLILRNLRDQFSDNPSLQ